ncbi:MAG TPA: serine hydrolase [Prolixibacteraceae bacterium]|nr:serine hydrolase [Prolixibacteraceae bacterium]HCR91205.1 serine hydrolase [Prolixibacteraceae bacterium]HCU61463.1 serine hydrolase [Prolixibacteraceae bacterium]
MIFTEPYPEEKNSRFQTFLSGLLCFSKKTIFIFNRRLSSAILLSEINKLTINTKFMKQFISILSLIILFQFQTFAQPLVETKPENVGFSSEKLKLVDDLANQYVIEGKTPGGVILVARKGKIVYYKNFGYRDIGKREKAQKDDIFRIASMSKAITTVGIMQLFERGLIGFDEPVHKYIPAFKQTRVLESFDASDSSYTTVQTKSPITIRQLLTHTSGIPYSDYKGNNLNVIFQKFGLTQVGLSHASLTTEDFINQLAKVPLAFQPGERYQYGLNMDVLGRVIEVVSGMKLSDYFRKNIFDPLGMNDTWFYLPKEKQNRLYPVFSHTDNGLVQATESGMIKLLDYPKRDDNNHYAGGGGLSSTAMDYARFIQALLNNGQLDGKRILSRKTIEVMTADQMVALNKEGKGYSQIPGNTYCLGFSLITEQAKGMNSKSVGTYEWGGYFSTKFFIDPQEELIFVGMTQVSPNRHGYFWDRVTTLVYSAITD